jgi:UDPglucose 6-dehydrogenase
MKISIIGLGFVGTAMLESFTKCKIPNITVYDKYKNIGSFNECLSSDIIFLALPTPYNEKISEYDKSAIFETLEKLEEYKYTGLIIIKSTVEPTSTESCSDNYKTLKIFHNPEFLTQRTAFDDFHNQSHIVIGYGKNCSHTDIDIIANFYLKYYPSAELSIVTSNESESMKIFANSFYAVKVQFFNELYLLCNAMNVDYDTVKNLMLKNNWINPMHTQIPGPDGKLSYGGACFPKDTNALLKYMQKYSTPHKVLESTILERNEMRNDNVNIIN